LEIATLGNDTLMFHHKSFEGDYFGDLKIHFFSMLIMFVYKRQDAYRKHILTLFDKNWVGRTNLKYYQVVI